MGSNKKQREQTRGRGGNSGNRRRRQRRGNNNPSTSADDAPPTLVVRPLDINEQTRWKPRSRIPNDNNQDNDEAENDARLVLLLLNKLTPQNFDKLVSVFLSQTSIQDSIQRTKDAIHAIIERASLDRRYTHVYAMLCKRLDAELIPEGGGDCSSCVAFREALLHYCREELSSGDACVSNHDPQEEENLFEHPQEREARLILARQRYVGSKRFLGELFNATVFTLADILSFVEILFNQINEQEEIQDLKLKGLCTLLDACGMKLDETAGDSPEMQQCWRALEEMTCKEVSPTFSFRSKCLVLDLLELKRSGWNPVRYSCRQRKVELVAKPLQRDRDFQAETRNARSHKSKRGGKKKEKSVRFASK